MSDHIYTHDEIIQAAAPIRRNYHSRQAILFGSYARQEAANITKIIDIEKSRME